MEQFERTEIRDGIEVKVREVRTVDAGQTAENPPETFDRHQWENLIGQRDAANKAQEKAETALKELQAKHDALQGQHAVTKASLAGIVQHYAGLTDHPLVTAELAAKAAERRKQILAELETIAEPPANM